MSPTRPELSQAGRTVLVLGGSTGIGHAIARNFCADGASKVIILARRQPVLAEAVAKLQQSFPNTEVVGRAGGFLSLADATALWDSLEKEEVAVDVLVLSATHTPALEPLLVQGTARVWEDYEANVHAPLAMVDRFCHQPNHESQKYCLFVSTHLIYNWHLAPRQPGYNLTKNAFTAAMSMIARDTPVEKMQIVSFHPGAVFTETAKALGLTGTEPHIPWFDEEVPGQFTVWAASPKAAFLHGRFVWAGWDVDELATGETRKKIDSDPLLFDGGCQRLGTVTGRVFSRSTTRRTTPMNLIQQVL